MEEKIYFEPSDYGSIKKPNNKTRRKNKTNYKAGNKYIRLLIFFAFLIGISTIALFLLKGKASVSGHFPENLRNEYLECRKAKVEYAPVSSVSTDDNELKINMVFYGDKQFNSASLRYTLYYDTHETAYGAEARAHAQFTKELGKDGLSFEEFNNKFSIIDNSLVVTLYLSGSSIKEQENKYFLIEKKKDGSFPDNIQEYENNFVQQGFSCENSIK